MLSLVVSAHPDTESSASLASSSYLQQSSHRASDRKGEQPSLRRRAPPGPRLMKTWRGPRHGDHSPSPADAAPDHVASVQVYEFGRKVTHLTEPGAESKWWVASQSPSDGPLLPRLTRAAARYTWLRQLCHGCELRPGSQHVVAQARPRAFPHVLIGRVVWVHAERSQREAWPAVAPHVVVNQPGGGFDLYRHRPQHSAPGRESLRGGRGHGHPAGLRRRTTTPRVDRYKDFQARVVFKAFHGLGQRGATERDMAPSRDSAYLGPVPPGRSPVGVGWRLAGEWDRMGWGWARRRQFVEEYERALLH